MTLRFEDLYTDFIIVPDSSISLGEAIDQLPERRDGVYVVFVLPDGRYVSIMALNLLKAADGIYKSNEKSRIERTSLRELFDSLGFAPLHLEDTTLEMSNQPWRESPTGSAVVLSSGEAVGVLPTPTVFRGGAEPAYGAAGLGGQEPEAQPVKRIDVQTYDGTTRHNPKLNPLQLNKRYTLKLSIRDERRQGSDVQEAVLKYLWAEGEQEVELTVMLQSADFECTPESKTLTVKRQGSSDTIEFQLRARYEGRCELKVLFYKEDNFIQLLTLKYTVVDGELFSYDPSGRIMDAAFVIKPRNLNLTILESRGGFQMVMSKDGRKETATLPLTKNMLDKRIKDLRKTLKDEVVYLKDAQGNPVYQLNVNITPDYRDKALRLLAEAGYKMYRAVFFPEEAELDEARLQQLASLGNYFYQLVRGGQTLKVQVFSQHFMLPWGLLYIAKPEEYDPEQVNPKWFLGLSHIIEHIPLWETLQMQSTNTVMNSLDGLNVSLNVNLLIDGKLKMPLVAPQIAYWQTKEQGGQIKLVTRDNAITLLRAMSMTQDTIDELVYFYCHATSTDLTEGGPDRSNLVFAPNDKLTLGALKQNAPYTRLLPGEPLVFINACESAELSPLFYDGFVPYFLAKGARGVIGTECEIPAIFAREWANVFFERFLAGEELGKLVLELRNQFLEQKNNILGLLYALYVDADTHIEPPIV